MIHLETNPLPSAYVPSSPDVQNEAKKKISTSNGHTIESIEELGAFQRSSGCELDRMISATNQLRNIVQSDTGKRMRVAARQMKGKK